MSTIYRRYDIDWLRVIAIGLLLIYHVAIGFQPWGVMIGFITNEKPWGSLWIPMAMLNIWRIPLLFFVSGMGVYFAIQQRNLKQLLIERSRRILIPFLFGMFVIVPLHVYIWQAYYNLDLSYPFHPGHLWFLGNIFIYVLVLSPIFFWLKRNVRHQFVKVLIKVLSNPLGLFLIMSLFIAEAVILDPRPFEMYVMTWHGFTLGLLAFFTGFCFVLSGITFWSMLLKWYWLFLLMGTTLFAVRIIYLQFVPGYLLAIESTCWIFTVFAFAYKYLNHPSKTLRYLSEAAYPVYIIHMVFLYLASWLLFPREIDIAFKFILVLLLTGIGCFTTYELIIKRVNFVRPLFGLKKMRPDQ